MTLHSRVHEVTERLRERSRDSRAAYLDRLRRAAEAGPRRTTLSCGNLAHGFAACGLSDKQALKGAVVPNLAIITARSEEHTSELQSLMRISYAVFCLKKKTTKINQRKQNHNTYNLGTASDTSHDK